MTRSDSIGNIAAALAKAQKAIKGAIKDAKNPHFNSRYADLESISEACRDPLADNEIAVVQSPSTPEAGLFGMVTMLAHSSGEWLQSDLLTVQARDAGPQAAGSCTTYLRRYQLAAMAGVAPADDDAEAAEGRSRSQAPPVSRSSPGDGHRHYPSDPNGGASGAIPRPDNRTLVTVESRLVAGNEHDKDGVPVYANVNVDTETGEELPTPPFSYVYISSFNLEGGWYHVGFLEHGVLMTYKTRQVRWGKVAMDAYNLKTPVTYTTKPNEKGGEEGLLDSIETFKPWPLQKAEPLAPMTESEVPF